MSAHDQLIWKVLDRVRSIRDHHAIGTSISDENFFQSGRIRDLARPLYEDMDDASFEELYHRARASWYHDRFIKPEYDVLAAKFKPIRGIVLVLHGVSEAPVSFEPKLPTNEYDLDFVIEGDATAVTFGTFERSGFLVTFDEPVHATIHIMVTYENPPE